MSFVCLTGEIIGVALQIAAIILLASSSLCSFDLFRGLEGETEGMILKLQTINTIMNILFVVTYKSFQCYVLYACWKRMKEKQLYLKKSVRIALTEIELKALESTGTFGENDPKFESIRRASLQASRAQPSELESLEANNDEKETIVLFPKYPTHPNGSEPRKPSMGVQSQSLRNGRTDVVRDSIISDFDPEYKPSRKPNKDPKTDVSRSSRSQKTYHPDGKSVNNSEPETENSRNARKTKHDFNETRKSRRATTFHGHRQSKKSMAVQDSNNETTDEDEGNHHHRHSVNNTRRRSQSHHHHRNSDKSRKSGNQHQR
jgi:hypothetical protein